MQTILDRVRTNLKPVIEESGATVTHVELMSEAVARLASDPFDARSLERKSGESAGR